MMTVSFRFVRDDLSKLLRGWESGTLTTPEKIKAVKYVLTSIGYRTGASSSNGWENLQRQDKGIEETMMIMWSQPRNENSPFSMTIARCWKEGQDGECFSESIDVNEFMEEAVSSYKILDGDNAIRTLLESKVPTFLSFYKHS